MWAQGGRKQTQWIRGHEMVSIGLPRWEVENCHLTPLIWVSDEWEHSNEGIVELSWLLTL